MDMGASQEEQSQLLNLVMVGLGALLGGVVILILYLLFHNYCLSDDDEKDGTKQPQFQPASPKETSSKS